jgi:trehalose-phosphatase
MRAFPLDGVKAVLSALSDSDHTSVVIISGRPVHEIKTLLGDVDLMVIGCHGYEILTPDNGLTVKSPASRQVEGLEEARGIARQYGYLHKLEVKVGSMAFHTRGMPDGAAFKAEEHIFREWSRLGSFGLGCRRFNGGVEVTCNGWNKGDSLSDLLHGQPEGTFPVYVGDDATDEDAFRVMRKGGCGIKVGPISMPTAAKGLLRDCREVVAFLESWLALFDTEH